MPDVYAALEQAKHLIEKGHGSEPAKLVLPRREAARRKENKEGRTRLVKDMLSGELYGEWNAEFDRWIENSGGHAPIAYNNMLRALQQFPGELIRRLSEEGLECTGSDSKP